MWQGIKTVTGYNNNTTATIPSDSTLPDTLNQVFARFDHRSSNPDTIAAPPGNNDLLQLQTHQFTATLCRVDARKAPGPDGVPGHAFNACAQQRYLQPSSTFKFADDTREKTDLKEG